jgi:hypothetical protein
MLFAAAVAPVCGGWGGDSALLPAAIDAIKGIPVRYAVAGRSVSQVIWCVAQSAWLCFVNLIECVQSMPQHFITHAVNDNIVPVKTSGKYCTVLYSTVQ